VAAPAAEDKLLLKKKAVMLFIITVVILLVVLYVSVVLLYLSRKRWKGEKRKPTVLKDLWWESGKNVPPIPPEDDQKKE